MFARTAAGAVAFLILAAFTLVGTGCAALALDLALTPAFGPAWAAAATAFLLLIAPVATWVVLAVRGLDPAPRAGEEAMLRALASLAKANPVVAVLGAGLLGVAAILVRPKRP